jgi:NADPH2 dehydrogenase
VPGIFKTPEVTREEISNDFLRDIWRGKPYISDGGYNRETAIARADKDGDLITFGRYYTSNVRDLSIIQLCKY